MDRNRESRRGNGSSSSRRRSRGSFREPSGVGEVEDGINEIHDSSTRLRDRSGNSGKKDRSSRRRRLNSNDSFHIDRDEIAEGSTDESMDEDQEEEEEPVRAANLRRTTTAAAVTTATNRVKPPWKASDEMIGVSVPRKARTAFAKRSHESSSVFGMGGGSAVISDGLLHRQSSSSPVRTSAASVSPPSSNASMRAGKRGKPVTMKSKPPKTAKQVSISESEVEVARFLYGLTRLQAQPSPSKQENFQSSSPKHEFKQHSSNEGSVSGVSKASSPVSTPISPRSSSQPLLLQNSSSSPATVMAPKRKKPRPVKLEDSGSNTILACSSIPPESSSIGNFMSPNGAAASQTKIEADKDSEATKMEVYSPRSEKNAGPADGGSCQLEPSLQISSPLQTASQRDVQIDDKVSPPGTTESKPLPSVEKKQHWTALSTRESLASDDNCQAPVDQSTPKASSPSRDSVPTLGPNSKLDDPKIICPVSTADEGLHGDKFKIDLMALPTNSSLDSDVVPENAEKNFVQTSDHKPSPVIEETANGDREISFQAGNMEAEAIVKSDFNIPGIEEKIETKVSTGKIDLEKQSVIERNNGLSHEENRLDKGGNKQQSQKHKSAARQTERIVPPGGIVTSTSTPIPATHPGWPGGLAPFGYMGSNPANLSGVPPLQVATPMEGNSAMPNAPFVMLPPTRSSRCATHYYIAQLIHYQQQVDRFNPFWPATGSANFYGAKPYNLNILPNSDSLMLGGPIIRNSTPLPHSGPLGSGSSLNGHNPKEKVSNSFDAQRKQPQVPQSSQQGPPFIFPMTQSKTGGSKSGSLTDNAGLLSASAAAAATAGSSGTATVNSNFSSLAAATSDPQYLAILHGNYPFSIPPAYRPHIGQQQQPQPAMAHSIEFVRPFYPSQLLQFQPQSLPQTQNPATSTGSSSSQKRLQSQHCFPTVKPPLDSREPTGNGEDGADSRNSLVQKKLPSQNFPGNTALNSNISQNFTIMAAAMGGKQHQQQQQQQQQHQQHQQPNDATLHMGFKGMEITQSVPPGHSVLQSLPELSWHHYHIPAQPLQLPDQFQNLGANQVKTAGKVTGRSSDKSPEFSRPQTSVAAASASQQFQKQAMARTNDANINMNFKGMEITAPVPPGHSVLQSFPDFSRHHYQIPGQPLQFVDQFQMAGANQAKTTGKVTTRSSDRSPESGGRTQTAANVASAAHQFQKQALARANDANFHMSLKGMEVTASIPPGHSVLQSLPEFGRHHYQIPGQPLQLVDQLQIPGANQAKTVGKVKSPESGRPQTGVASTAEQHQKQSLARTKQASANSSLTPTCGMTSADRIPAIYSSAAMKAPAGSATFPNMPGSQWKMPQRISSPVGSPGNSTHPAQPPPKGSLPGQSASQQSGQGTAGSLAGKPAKAVSSQQNSGCKPTSAGPAMLAQSGQQMQNPTKTQLLQQQQQHQIQSQQFFYPSSEPILQHSGPSAGLYQKRQVAAPNQPAQAIFPSGLNQRRPGPPAHSAPLTLANASAYMGGGGKAPAGYNSLGGSSAAVMAASYTQSASNLPVKSAEQKPAAA